MARLAQASAALGDAFDAALVSSRERHDCEMDEIARRLAELEAWRAETVGGDDARLAPAQIAAIGAAGGPATGKPWMAEPPRLAVGRGIALASRRGGALGGAVRAARRRVVS
jgi:hypothetical protein